MKKLLFTLTVIIASTAMIFSQVDRKHPPKPLPERDIHFGKTEQFTLSNGLKVIVVENHKLPIVRVDLTLDITAIKEGEKAGYLGMFGQMLRAGTQNFTKEDLDEKIDYLGSDFYIGSTSMGVYALKKQIKPSMEIFKELLYNPTFSNQVELDRLKKQAKAELEAGDKTPDVISGRVENVLLYGKEDAWGEYVTEKTLNNINLSDFKTYYTNYFKPNIGYVTIVGDITLSEAKTMAKECFSSWKIGEVKQDIPTLKRNTSAIKIAFVDLPTATQSSISVIGLVDLKKSDKDYFTNVLGNSVLGDGTSGRLFKDLREKHGWTYGAYSILNDNYKRLGKFGAYAQVRNEVTDSAVVEFIKNIRDITIKPPTEEELSLKKSEYNGNFALMLEKSETVARFIRTQMMEGLPINFYENYLKSLNKVSAKQIPISLNKTIHPDNLIILVVGNGEEVLNGLEKLGYPIEFYDKFGNPVNKPTGIKEVTDITLKEVLNKFYVGVAGSKEKLEKLKSLIIEGEMKLSQIPQPLPFVFKFLAPNKNITLISFMGQTMKHGFDGINIFSSMGESDKDQIEEFKHQKGYFPELFYTDSEAKIEGKVNIDGKETYKISITNGNNKKNIYYDSKTGLKLKEEATGKIGTAITEFYDYKDFGGYKFPTKINTITQEQNMSQFIKKYTINPKISDEEFK